MKSLRGSVATLGFVAAMATTATGQQANGKLTANGKSASLTYAAALEVDSSTEPGYLDVVVVLADRKLSPEEMLNTDRLEEMSRKEGLVALRLLLDPDAKVKNASPYHPAFSTLISSAAFVRWEPSAYDESKAAGRVHTEGTQEAFGQRWDYDLTFSAPILLDPEAKTTPAKPKFR